VGVLFVQQVVDAFAKLTLLGLQDDFERSESLEKLAGSPDWCEHAKRLRSFQGIERLPNAAGDAIEVQGGTGVKGRKTLYARNGGSPVLLKTELDGV
jgi:hypothetical protein